MGEIQVLQLLPRRRVYGQDWFSSMSESHGDGDSYEVGAHFSLMGMCPAEVTTELVCSNLTIRDLGSCPTTVPPSLACSFMVLESSLGSSHHVCFPASIKKEGLRR